LKSQNTRTLSQLEQQTNGNLLNVNNVITDTTKQVKERRGWKNICNVGILFGYMITFCVVFIIIRTIPMRKNACLFTCKERDDSYQNEIMIWLEMKIVCDTEVNERGKILTLMMAGEKTLLLNKARKSKIG